MNREETVHISKLEKIKILATETGSIDLHSFHFINLKLVKIAAGASWPKLRGKIFDVSEHFLEKRLSQDDIIIRLKDGFLVVFANIDSDEAVVFGHQLSNHINQFFIGDDSIKDLQVASKHNRVTIEELDKTLSEMRSGARNSTPPAAANFTPGDTENKQIDPIKRCTFHYRPMWDSYEEIISTNFHIPHLNANGQHLCGIDILQENNATNTIRDFDLHMLDNAQNMFTNIVNIEKRCIITVTVNYQTLKNDRGRVAYFNQLSKTSKSLRRFFFIRVDEIPTGAPRSALIEIFRSLGPLCGATMVHSCPSSASFNLFHECNVSLFGFSLQKYTTHAKELTDHHLKKNFILLQTSPQAEGHGVSRRYRKPEPYTITEECGRAVL
jgi:hypothetical protein